MAKKGNQETQEIPRKIITNDGVVWSHAHYLGSVFSTICSDHDAHCNWNRNVVNSFGDPILG